jgi:predicted dehydrogenase
MAEAAERSGLKLMEAFMYRFHPQMALAKQVLDSGRLGELRLIRAAFSFNSTPSPANPRFQADQGPGALMDVGCYCVNVIRLFSGGAPKAVSAWDRWDDSFQGDMACAGVLEYDRHAALFDCSFEASGRAGVEVVGNLGRMEIPKPWLPGTDPAAIRVWDKDGSEELTTEGVNHYQLMVEHFGECILNNQPPVRGPEDALENMRVLDAIRRSAREQRRVPLSEVE